MKTSRPDILSKLVDLFFIFAVGLLAGGVVADHFHQPILTGMWVGLRSAFLIGLGSLLMQVVFGKGARRLISFVRLKFTPVEVRRYVVIKGVIGPKYQVVLRTRDAVTIKAIHKQLQPTVEIISFAVSGQPCDYWAAMKHLGAEQVGGEMFAGVREGDVWIWKGKAI